MVAYPKKNTEYGGTFTYPQADFALAVSCGQIDYVSYIGKFGSNTDQGTSEEILWSGANVASSDPFPSSAAKVKVRAGGNAADTNGGTGGNSIEIQGLNSNWDLVTETILLAGALESAESTNDYYRVVRIKVSSGSGGVNVGDIILDQVGGNCIAHVLAGNGQTTQAFFSIPRNYKGYLVTMEAHVDSTKTAKVSFWQRVDANTATPSKRLVREFFGVTGDIHTDFHIPISFDECTDIYMSAVGGLAGAELSGMFDLYLVKDS